MTDFRIVGPDGKKYKVSGENAEGALATLQKMLAPPSADPAVAPEDTTGFSKDVLAEAMTIPSPPDVPPTRNAVPSGVNLGLSQDPAVPRMQPPAKPPTPLLDTNGKPAVDLNTNPGYRVQDYPPSRAPAPSLSPMDLAVNSASKNADPLADAMTPSAPRTTPAVAPNRAIAGQPTPPLLPTDPPNGLTPPSVTGEPTPLPPPLPPAVKDKPLDVVGTSPFAGTPDRSVITGLVTKVLDGDTLEVGGHKIRVQALDCPEGQRFGGAKATALLTELTDGTIATVETNGEVSYDRLTGYVTVDGKDVGQQMIDAEVCGVWEKYDSKGKYVATYKGAPMREDNGKGVIPTRFLAGRTMDTASDPVKQRGQTLTDIEERLKDPNLPPETRAFLEQNLADLSEGQQRLSPAAPDLGPSFPGKAADDAVLTSGDAKTYDPFIEAMTGEVGNMPERMKVAAGGNRMSVAERDAQNLTGEIADLSKLDPAAKLAAIDKRKGEIRAGMELTDDPMQYAALEAELQALGPEETEARSFLENPGEREGIITDRVKRLAEAGTEQATQQARINAAEDSMTPTNPKPGVEKTFVQVFSSLADMAPSVASSVITKNPLPGMIYMFGLSKGAAYVDKRADGQTPDKARAASNLYGLAEGIPEMLPLGVLLKAGKGAISKITGLAVAEGTTEMLTSGLQSLVDVGLLKETMTWAEAAKAMAESGIVGAASGGLLGGGAMATEGMAKRAKDRRDAKAIPPTQAGPARSDPLADAMTPPSAPQNIPDNIPAASAPDPLTAAMAPDTPPSVQPRTDQNPVNKPDAEPSTDGFEVMDEVETVDGETRPTGRKVRINTATGDAEVVDEDSDAVKGEGIGGVGPTGDNPQAKREADVVSTPSPPAVPEPKQPENVGATKGPTRKFLTHSETLAIETDPKTFQYKGGADTEGVTEALRGVKSFDPNRAGQVVLFETKDGRTIVADGHQRTGLARRMAEQGQEDVGGMAAVVYREADGYTATEVTDLAALKNIGEGSGTAVDAARVLKNRKDSIADLGLPPNSALVRKAEGLRRLGDNAFGMVVNGVASEEMGDVVGRNVTDARLQPQVLAYLTKNAPANLAQAAMIARDMAADSTTETQDSLFGPEQVQQSLYVERAKVLDGALKSLGTNIRTFRTLIDKAETISTKGNKLDAKQNATQVDDDTKVRQYLTSQANMKGPISDALTKAAEILRSGGTVARAVQSFIGNTRGALQGTGTGSQAPASGGSPDEVRAEVEPEAVAPEDAGDDLFAAMLPPASTIKKPDNAPKPQDDLLAALNARPAGKTFAQMRKEDEAKVKAAQSKMRTAAPQGDEGPLFDTQGDIEKPVAPADKLLSDADAVRAAHTSPGDVMPAGDTDLFGTPQHKSLLAKLAAVSGLDARARVADEWVLAEGEKIGLEILVMMDKSGNAVNIARGRKSGDGSHAVNPSVAGYRMAKAGVIAYSVHNHPRATGPSTGDILMTGAGFGREAAIVTIKGRHSIKMGDGFPSVSLDEGGNADAVMQGLRDADALALPVAQGVFTKTGDNQDRADAVGRALANLMLDRIGVLRYEGNAAEVLRTEGVDFDGFYTGQRDSLALRLRRAGFHVIEGNDTSGDSAAGSAGTDPTGQGAAGGIADNASDSDGIGRVQDEPVSDKPKPLTPRQKAKARAQAIEKYFTPGNIVPSYGGRADRVLSFTRTMDGGFTVSVQAVYKGSGDTWQPVKDEAPRTHGTSPTDAELRKGPLEVFDQDSPTPESFREEEAPFADLTDDDLADLYDVEQPMARDTIAQLLPRMRAELDRLDLSRVKLMLDDSGADWQGMVIGNPFTDMSIIIGASVDPMKTVYHEVIHIFRGMNLFTPQEWTALETVAGREWIAKYEIEERYPDLTREEQIEEAIAEAFADAVATKTPPKGGLIITAFNKMARLMRAMRNVLNGAGFQTAEDVFGRAYAGELTKRAAAPGAMSAQRQAATDMTKTEAFKRWFGDSKVVDANGKPLVVYHGTDADFEAFDTRASRRLIDTGQAMGSWFASSPEAANIFGSERSTSGQNVIPAYLHMKKPLEVTSYRELVDMAWKFDGRFSSLRQYLIKKGYDGVILRGSTTDGGPVRDDFVVFEPTQIKSAFNRGTFNPKDPRISYQRAPLTEDDRFAAQIMQELAQVDDLFRNPTSTATTIDGVFGEIDNTITYVGDMAQAGEGSSFKERAEKLGVEKMHLLRTGGEKKHDFYIYEADGNVWMDVSTLTEGGAGSVIYSAVADYAFNNGLTFIGDPEGLSDIALRRRTDAMLSSALKHGTTRHLAPHERQIEGDEALGVQPLLWKTGDDLANVAALIKVSVSNLAHYVPEINRARYDFATRSFRSSQGKPISDEALDGFRDRFPRIGAAGAGRKTLKRGILLNTLSRAESSERPGILERALRQPDQLVAGGLSRTFYQRAKAGHPQAKAHKASALSNSPFIPDRRIWEELRRSGIPIWSRIRNGAAAARDATDLARMQIQDKMLPFMRAQDAVMRARGAPLSKEADVYTIETTYSGKVGRHLFEIDEQFTKPIIDLIAKTKGALTVDAVGQWLTARHAIERNARIAAINPKFRPTLPNGLPNPEFTGAGGSGMSDADAQKILADAASGPHKARLTEIGRLIDALRDRSMSLRVDKGLMTADEAAIWKAQYKHYVPLKGFAETEHGDAMLDVTGIGKAYNVKGQESKRALGRTSEAFNPLQAAITQAQEVAIRAEKNAVGVSMYELATSFPAPALWEIKPTVEKRYFNKTTGLVETRSEDPISMLMDPNEMAIKVKGKEVRILFHDPRLARAAGTIGADQMGSIMRVMSMLSGFFSMTRTMLNPEFMLTNAFRDFQTAQFNAQAFGINPATGKSDRAAIALAMGKNWRKALLGAIRGQKGKEDTEWSKHFRDFQRAGGQVSFWKLEQPEAAKDEMEKRVKIATGNKMARAAKVMTTPSAFFSMRDNAVLSFIERTNTAIDNAIRLAAFVEARKRGWTEQDAAFLAKELTVNFNRRGEKTSTLNAFYPFFNAAVQGSLRTVTAVVTSRRVAVMVTAAFAFGIINDLLNAALSEEDDDGELAYDKIPDYRSQRNIHLALWGKGEDPAAIPMPYGYNVFPYAGQQIGKMLRGVVTKEDAFGNVLGAMVGAFSPINGGTLASTISPFLTDPIVEMAENKNFTGNTIYPRFPETGAPDSQTFYESSTEASQWVAATLNSLTGGDFNQSGAVDVSPETLDYLSAFVVGSAGAFWGKNSDILAKIMQGKTDEIERRNVPFVRNFTSATDEWLDSDRYRNFGLDVQDANADAKAYVAAGMPVPDNVAVRARLYEDYLKANRELKSQGDWNPNKEDALTPRAERTIWLDFNRKYLLATRPKASQ